MAHTKSAIKRLRTSTEANKRNRARKSELKTYERKFQEAIASGDSASALELVKVCSSRLDKAVKAGTIHANKAANKKSQFDKLVNSLSK